MSTLREKLTPLYQPLFGELFDRPAIEERRATCDDCAMCDKGGGAPVTVDYFNPSTKCCTFHPNLPNYLVGAVLSDPDSAEGAKRLRARIESRIAVSPCWLSAPKTYQLLLTASKGTNVFGRAKSLLCPYYDDGRCSVWRHRESVCSTFFCKYEGGRLGHDFWMALKVYLSFVEITLAEHAMRTIDPSLVEPKVTRLTLELEDVENLPPPPAAYAAMWGARVGREEEYYRACHDLVRSLDRATFTRLIDEDPEGKRRLADLTLRLERTSSVTLPTYLVRNAKTRTTRTPSGVVTITYNPNDAFLLDPELFDVLGMLDGKKTVAENLTWLASEHGIELTEELLIHLYQQGILVTPVRRATAACSTSD